MKEQKFYCYACFAEFTVIHNGEDEAQFCPFCRAMVDEEEE